MIAICVALVLQVALFVHAWRKSGRTIAALEREIERVQNRHRARLR